MKKTGHRRVYLAYGSFYYIQDLQVDGVRRQRWHKLCRESAGESSMLARLSELLRELDAHVAVGDFSAAVDAFCKHHLPGLSASARKEYLRNFKVIVEAFSAFRVADVRPRHIMEFLDQFSEQPTARHHYRARLSTFFNWAIRCEMCSTNPCAVVKLPAPPKRDVLMTPDVFHAIRDQLGPMHQCALDLYYLLYQRGTDVRLLKWAQVQHGSIQFKPTKTARKTGVKVDIAITPDIAAVLDRARAIGASEYVLHDSGAPLTAREMRHAFDRAAKRAGASGYNLRDIRPMAATAAKNLGYSVDQIRAGLAHVNVSTTEVYLRDRLSVSSPLMLPLPVKK